MGQRPRKALAFGLETFARRRGLEDLGNCTTPSKAGPRPNVPPERIANLDESARASAIEPTSPPNGAIAVKTPAPRLLEAVPGEIAAPAAVYRKSEARLEGASAGPVR